MNNEIERRDLLKGLGAASIASLSGCASILNGGSEIRDQANQTRQNLKSELPWSSYQLGYITESVNVGTERLGATGVENASQYRINMKVSLSDNSDDLRGWLSTSGRRSEFFSLLNETTYDMFSQASEDFSRFEPPQRPSHRNQVTEYQLRVDADSCSYVQDTVPATRTGEILSSRSAYANYVDNGEEYEINIEEGFLGTDIFC